MDLFVYSDESGVFDRVHGDYFVFGGLICFGQEQKELFSRLYSHVENIIKENKNQENKRKELKASSVTNKQKSKLYRSLNNIFKFSVIIKLKNLDQNIFENKKHKQRYMDFAYKMVLKKCFQCLINNGLLNPNEINNIYVNVDEHTTATDGLYELRENLRREFQIGTFNPNYQHYFDPIFPRLRCLNVNYCNSSKKLLIRASDIIANRSFHVANENGGYIKGLRNTFVLYMPSNQIGSKGLEYFKEKDKQWKS